MGVIVTFCALVGATCFGFMRFMVWRYTLLFKVLRWLFGIAAMTGKASAIAGGSRVLWRSSGYPVQYKTLSIVSRSRGHGGLSEGRPMGLFRRGNSPVTEVET